MVILEFYLSRFSSKMIMIFDPLLILDIMELEMKMADSYHFLITNKTQDLLIINFILQISLFPSPPAYYHTIQDKICKNVVNVDHHVFII